MLRKHFQKRKIALGELSGRVWKALGSKEEDKSGSHSLQLGTELQENWDMYLNNPSAFAAIQTIASTTLSGGFEIIHDNPEIVSRYEQRFNKIYPKLYTVMINTLIFRDSYAIPIKGKDGFITDLNVLFPLYVSQDKDGNFYLKEKTKQKERIKDEIWQFQLMPRSDEPHGIALLSIAKKPLIWKREIDESVTLAIKRHGFAKYHVIVSPDKRGVYPDDTTMTKLQKEFRKIRVGHEFVSTDKVEVKPIDTAGFPDLLNYLTYYTNLAATGCLIPAEALGQGASAGTFSTSKVRMEFFLKNTIPYYQLMLSYSISNDLLGEKAEGAIFKLKLPKEIEYTSKRGAD